MDMPATIRDAEKRLKAAGVSINDFCDEAEIHRATWQRWKAGRTSPTLAIWSRVQEALPKPPRRAA